MGKGKIKKWEQGRELEMNEWEWRDRVQEVLFPFFIFHFPALEKTQFHVVVVQWRQRNEQQQQKINRDARAKLLFG